MYKRYETLLKLVTEYGLGFASTNQWENSKPHFLQMRKEDLVDYVDGRDNRIMVFHNRYHGYPEGPTLNGLWYTVSFKGLGLLRELFPENEAVKNVMRDFLDGIFALDQIYLDEIKYRK